MAVYKVIQDIEAEDKLLGPLTLKSFIYAAIAGLLAFINVRLLIAGGPIYIKLVIILVLLFPMLLFGVLASPLGRDQPTEVWLLSHIRFLLKPRQRIWDQSGISNLVTITVPKRLDKQLTKGFSQTEVQSRLQALASTLDSRGWVVKNAAVSLGGQPSYLDSEDVDSDRLVDASSLAQPAAVIDVRPADDILDEQNNATAQKFNRLVKDSDAKRKQSILDKINAVRRDTSNAGSDTRFLDAAQTSGDTTFVGKATVAPGAEGEAMSSGVEVDLSAEAQALLEREHKWEEEVHRRSAGFHTKVDQTSQSVPKQNSQPEPVVTAAGQADKLELAQSGSDLSVASIASLANRNSLFQQLGPNEAVISLH